MKFHASVPAKAMPKVALSASVGLAAYWGYLFFNQTRHVFSPAVRKHVVEHADRPNITPVELPVAPGVVLEGWVVQPAGREPQQAPGPCAIYFGGRSEDVRWLCEEASGFGQLPLVFFNYRGYGRSGGVPNEQVMVSDAKAIHAWVKTQPWCDPSRLSLIGRSLGTGVAMQLASSVPVHKLALFTPYDNLVSVARRKVPLAPVSLLLRSKFNSAAHAVQVRCATLILLAEKDTVVPHSSSLGLMKHFPVKPLVATVKGSDHVSVPHDRDAQALVGQFLTA